MTISLSLTDSDQLCITDETGHVVFAPATFTGFIFLKSLLAARRAQPSARIGTDTRPTQGMVDAFLKSHKIAPAPPAMSAAQITARREAEAKRASATAEKLAKFSDLDLELDL